MNVLKEIEAGRAFVATLPGVINSALIGSATYLPDPADVDFAVLIRPDLVTFDYLDAMIAAGWTACSDYDGQHGKWGAVRCGHLNLMVTHDPLFFDRYKAAMEVCRALRLTHKQDRIAVCQIVRDGLTANEVSVSHATGNGLLGDVALLKAAVEAMQTCDPGDTSTGHVIPPSYDDVAIALAITAIKGRLGVTA